LGCYARSLEAPEASRRSYVELLASTWRADAATLAGLFGIDLHAPAFWQSSFAVLRQEIDRFQALVKDRNV
jgi:oligoendopeptidase F